MLNKIIQEPLLQFALIASLLFVFHQTIWPDDAEETSRSNILVSQADIEIFLQNQSGVYDKQRIDQALASMSQEKKQALIDGYFQEEALYREALSLGLDKNDLAVRRRLIQNMSLMAQQQIVPPPAGPSELLKYFQENSERYAIDAAITFTHVFAKSENTASELLLRLQTDGAKFEAASQYGERFIYHTNYVKRTLEFIDTHFGPSFSRSVFDTELPVGDWVGPVKSEHGWHLVMVSQRSQARSAGFAEVEQAVASDYAQQRAERARKQALLQITQSYSLQLSDDLNSNTK